MEEVDVAVVGGGPGGLALALAICRGLPGASVKVFERSPGYTPCGAGVRLSTPCLKAFEAIDPALSAHLQQQGLLLTRSITNDDKGNALRTEQLPAAKSGARYVPVMWGWHEVRLALFQRLPQGTVRFGSKFVSYQERPDGQLVLRFEGAQAPVRARVVIGADGFFSRVRQQCLADGPPQFQGTVTWRARVPWARRLPTQHSSWWFGSERLALLYPIPGTTCVWTCSAPLALLQAAGLQYDERGAAAGASSAQASGQYGAAALERCLKVMQGYPADIMGVIASTDPATVVEHGIYTRDPSSQPLEAWGRGCVTLLGDAAHPMRPTGQGLNCTIEDAAELAWHLQKYGLTDVALRRYEQRRIPRMHVIASFEAEAGGGSYKKEAKQVVERGQAGGVRGVTAAAYPAFLDNVRFQPLQPRGAHRWLGRHVLPLVLLAAAGLAAVYGTSAEVRRGVRLITRARS